MAPDLRHIKIGLIGGTGHEGSGLAVRFAQAGYSVTIGSRSETKALERAHALASGLRAAGLSVSLTGMANSALPKVADILFLTVPFSSAVETVQNLSLPAGKVVVDTTVPVTFEKGKVSLAQIEEGSSTLRIARFLPPDVDVAAAFKTIPARLLADVDSPLDCDVFVCSDSEKARALVTGLCESLPGLRAIDAGGLANAAIIERMSFLAIELNLRHKLKYTRFKLVGFK